MIIICLGLRVISNNINNGSEEEVKELDSSVVQQRIYCVEGGIGIATQEDFLNHLFTGRAQAVQNNIKNQIISKTTLQIASEYDMGKKKIWFIENLNKLRVSILEDSITLVLSRQNILEETLNQFATVDHLNLHKDIKIFFIDEEARDVGGVIREWLSIMTEEILKSENKTFEMINNGGEGFYTIHPESSFEMCHLAGQIFGKAIFEGDHIDGAISRLLMLKILSIDPTLEDLRYYDEQLYSSLAYLNSDGVDAADLGMDFTIMDSGKSIELKEKGGEIALTNNNKEEYIQLILDYYTFKRVETQSLAFINSFLTIIPHDYLSVFKLEELEQVLFGQKEIDIQDWKNNTFYKGKYQEDRSNVIIQWFWEELEILNNDEKRKFLQFCTGSKTLPIEGFKGLRGQK